MTDSPSGSGFLEELKRRRAVRAILIYLAATWAVLEVAGLLLPTFGAPEWALRALIIAAGIGLPIVIVLAWAFDFTTEGIRRAVPPPSGADTNPDISWLTGRSAATIAVLVLVSATAGWWVGGSRVNAAPSGLSPSAFSHDAVAVLPFGVRGSADLEYLAEGLVDLISEKLDGAGTLRSIDSRSVIGMARSTAFDLTDPADGVRLAISLGAGRFITGEVLEIGSQLRISATLRDTDSAAPTQTASVEGSIDHLFPLLDELVSSLLASTLSGPGARLQKIATRTSESLPATKAFLRGEQFHRAGRYRDASAAYATAIELDSTFALAYYKRSVVNDYNEEPDDYKAAQDAVRFSGELSPRDQTLVRALLAQRGGHLREAEEAYRTHLLRYPDEVGARVQLAEILYHGNPRRGRPMEESREWFEGVLEVEPENIEASLHLARLDGLAGRFDEVRRWSDFFDAVVANSERALEVNAMYMFGAGDTVGQRQIIERLDTMDWYYHAYVGTSALRYARNPVGASRILAARPPDIDYLDGFDIALRMVTGRYASVRRFLADGGRRRTAAWDVFDAFLLESDLLPADPALILPLLERLRRTEPEEFIRTSFTPLHDIVTPAVAGFERDWHVAQLLARLDRFDEAWAIHRRLAAVDEFPAFGTLKTDAATALEAELLYRTGNEEEALRVLRTLVFDVPSPALWMSFSDGTRARFLRAELELELGDPAAAKPFYEGFHGSYSHFDPFYIALAYERLGRIAELQNDRAAAIFNYLKFVEAWQDSDSELVPMREEVEARLARLTAEAPPPRLQ